MTLRISHVSFSRSGGAGAVAKRLVAAQQHAGLDSEFIHLIDTDLKNTPLASPRHTLAAAVDSMLIKNPAFPAMVSVTRDRINRKPSIRPDRDIIHLHWINGVTRPGDIPLSPHQAVVWTLHDMNPLTGGCHYSLACNNYASGCDSCPAVRPRFHTLVTKNLQLKKESLGLVRSLAIVTPSTWLADAASNSEMFHHHPIRVIRNPVDHRFLTTPHSPAIAVPEGELVGVVVAQDLDDPTKNVTQAVEAFSRHRQATGVGQLVLIGRGGKQFEGRPGVTLTGRLDVEGLISWCDAADHIILASEAENGPMVVFEAAARGCWPLLANNSGLAEIPGTLGGGNLFDTTKELSQLLAARHAAAPELRQKNRQHLSDRVAEVCHPARVESHYREVYQEQLYRTEP